jgi:hypothetical protein
MVIHPSLLVAVQLQPMAAPTATILLPPDDAMFADVGVTEDTHVAPACVTVKVLPPIVRVPVRVVVVVFAATL